MLDLDLNLAAPGVLAQTQPVVLDPGCGACPRAARGAGRVRTPCMGPNGLPGGLLLVMGGVTTADDAGGALTGGKTGQALLEMASRSWTGQIAMDVAIRCQGAAALVDAQDAADACRRYTAQVLLDMKPARVILCGRDAARVWLGRSIDTWSVGHGAGVLSDGTPYFMIPDPARADGNVLRRQEVLRALVWACKADPVPPPPVRAVLVQTVEDAEAVEAAILAADVPVTLDTETAGRQWWPLFIMLTAALAWRCPDGWRVAVWDEGSLGAAGTAKCLKAVHPAWGVLGRLLANPGVRKGAHNAKYDWNTARQALGVHCGVVDHDTAIWCKLLDAKALTALGVQAERVGLGGHKLEDKAAKGAAMRLLAEVGSAGQSRQSLLTGNAPGTPLQREVAAGYRAGQCGSESDAVVQALIPAAVRSRYCALDTLACALLREQMAPRVLGQPGLAQVWADILQPGIVAFADAERWGVPFSRDAIRAHGDFLRIREQQSMARLRGFTGDGFNPRSTDQVAALLYDTLKLPPPDKRNPRGTGEDILVKLAKAHPVVPALLDFRQVSTAMRYADGAAGDGGLLSHLAPDGRIHASIKQDGAESGRASIVDPALQTLPRPEDEDSALARNQIQAAPGWSLLEFDYSQLEVRVMAMLSQDPDMMDIYKRGVDFHRATAALVFGKPEDQITDAERSGCKTVVFGVAYGKTVKGLASDLGVSERKAQEIFDGVLGRFKRLRALIAQVTDEVRRTGRTWSMWNGVRGRTRAMLDIAAAERGLREHAERSAFNNVVQGTGSEFAMRGAVLTHQWIADERLPAELVLTVHDSELLHVRNDAVDECLWTVPRLMTSLPSYGVPLAVDAKIGTTYGSLKKIALPV